MTSLLPEKKKKSAISTPMLFVAFGLVFLILFNPTLRDLTGMMAGYVLNPIIGFGGHYPILTLFFASIILVVATTAIRHFLVDWVLMARTQEGMRSFQKEFGEARKSNNTYRIKKLTEAQPEVMALQGEVSKEQMKPMAFTMILVIPLFAWLGTTMLHPVGFDLEEASDAPYAVLMTSGLKVDDAFLSTSNAIGRQVYTTSTDVYAYAFIPPGGTAGTRDIVLHEPVTDISFHIPVTAAPTIPEGAKIADLAPGTYSFKLAVPTDANTTLAMTGRYPLHHVIDVALIAVQDGAVVAVDSADQKGTTMTFNGAVQLYAIIPDGQDGGENTGQALLHMTGAETRDIPVTTANIIEIDPTTAAPVYPYAAKMPWKEPWSLQELWWILPHWILLYSLFGIPFGQIAQRALKLWEYRNVDLDNDGHVAGESL